MKPAKQFAAALCISLAAYGIAQATVTSGAGGSGVTVGNSSLIPTSNLQYSDTFTGTADGSANANRPYAAAVQPAAAYLVENLYGNPTQNWGTSTNPAVAGFSFASDRLVGPTPGAVNGAPAYPGGLGVNQNTSGSGSLT